jgi:hypothetical protein
VPCGWVLGDAVYGADRRLRLMLEGRGQPYVLGIRGNDKLWSELDGQVGQHAPEALAKALPPQAWRRLSAGAGSKGERLFDRSRVRLVRLRAPPWGHWLLVRRSIADPEDLAYFVVFGPAGRRLGDLARVAGRRWLVEECFEAAKQEVGLADYEVRSWRGWHRHATLAMLALALLAALRARLNAAKGGGGPPVIPSSPSACPRSAAWSRGSSSPACRQDRPCFWLGRSGDERTRPLPKPSIADDDGSEAQKLNCRTKCIVGNHVEGAPMMERAPPGLRLMRSKKSLVASSIASMLPNSSQWVTSRRKWRQSISIGFSQGL